MFYFLQYAYIVQNVHFLFIWNIQIATHVATQICSIKQHSLWKIVSHNAMHSTLTFHFQYDEETGNKINYDYCLILMDYSIEVPKIQNILFYFLHTWATFTKLKHSEIERARKIANNFFSELCCDFKTFTYCINKQWHFAAFLQIIPQCKFCLNRMFFNIQTSLRVKHAMYSGHMTTFQHTI